MSKYSARQTVQDLSLKKTMLGENQLMGIGNDGSKALLNFKDTSNAKQYSAKDSRDLLVAARKSMNDGASELFARNGFELIDYTPNLPLYSFFWQGLVPVRYGGGYAETVSAFRLNFQLSEGRVTGTLSNDRILTGVKESKITVPAYPLQFAVGMTHFEMMKSDHINYDVLGFRIEALRLSYQKELEWNAMLGNVGINDIDETSTDFVPGLLNQKTDKNLNELSAIEYTLKKSWNDMTVDELVRAIVDQANIVKRDLMYDSRLYPNTLALPPVIMEKLLQPAILNATSNTAVGVAMSNFEYIEVTLSRLFNKRVMITELPYLDPNTINTVGSTTAGIQAGGEFGKFMFYLNDERAMRFNVTLPLTGGSFYQAHDGFFQNFLSIYTPLLVIYPTIVYVNNIADAPKPEEE